MSEDKYLRIKQVVERTGLSRPTIYNMMKDGTFPGKTALGERAVAWLESQIIQWMEERKSAVKTGLEAKPGRPPTASTKKIASTPAKTKAAITTVPTPLANKDRQTLATQVAKDDDWGHDKPVPTDAEMEAIRFGLLIQNQSKKSSGTPLKGRSKSVVIVPTTVKQKKSVGKTYDISVPRVPRKKK